jgi:DNA-binding XRE family transcriptional regulator
MANQRGRPRTAWTTGRFGSFVSSYRVDLLADEVGVDPASVYRWARGDGFPSIPAALAIVQVARNVGTTLTLEDIYCPEAGAAGDRKRA